MYYNKMSLLWFEVMLPQKAVFALEKELYCHTYLSHDLFLHLTNVTLVEELQPQDFSDMMISAKRSCVIESTLP